MGGGQYGKENPNDVVVGCAVWSYIQKRLGTGTNFSLFPAGGDVGVWMGFVAVSKRSPGF